MSMVTTMMMVVGDHEYEYDDDISDARGELLTNSNTEVLTLKFAIKATLDQNTVAQLRKSKNRRRFRQMCRFQHIMCRQLSQCASMHGYII